MAFGRWLITRERRHDWVGQLADAARRDPAFPKTGDPEDVRQHLSNRGAEAEMFEMLDDAEVEWLRTLH